MQIVIDISEEKYREIERMDWKNPIWADEELSAIHYGTVLSEHGRLIDVNEYYDGSFNDAREFLDNATTILEATKGVTE